MLHYEDTIKDTGSLQNQRLINHILHLADNHLILAQRNSEWCGHGPILEQDIAITNITLDLIGQSRLFYQYAAQLINADNNTAHVSEDTLAYHRNERDFINCLIVELPKGDWAQTILRQCFFSNYFLLFYEMLQNSNDKTISAIAEKSLKEVKYHVKWSDEWVLRLGDGTDDSNKRMSEALDILWPYTGELFEPGIMEPEVDYKILQNNWLQKINMLLEEATLQIPANAFMHTGGKSGLHTEYMGYILAEMQYLQRTYPDAEW